MKKRIKNSLNYFGFFLALSAIFFFGCRCSAPKPATDPLAGWLIDPNNPDPAITKDYQDFAQNLPPKGQKFTSLGLFYENTIGQHAIPIEVFEHNENASWSYILIYDKENKRIKATKYRHNRYQS